MALTYIFGSSFNLRANEDASNKPPCMASGPVFCSLDITNNFNIHCYQKHITLKRKTLFQCWGFFENQSKFTSYPYGFTDTQDCRVSVMKTLYRDVKALQRAIRVL